MIKLTDNLRLQVDKKEYKLTRTEYLVLQVLMKNKNQILSPQQIASEVECDYRYIQNNIIPKFRDEFGLNIPNESGYVFREEEN